MNTTFVKIPAPIWNESNEEFITFWGSDWAVMKHNDTAIIIHDGAHIGTLIGKEIIWAPGVKVEKEIAEQAFKWACYCLYPDEVFSMMVHKAGLSI